MPYASWSSATSLISIPTRASVSVSTSAGKAGSVGSAAHTPTPPPTVADARAAPTISASAISSADSPGNCARSVAWSRTRSRGAMATTCVTSQSVPRAALRLAARQPRPPARALARALARAAAANLVISLRRSSGRRASVTSVASSAACATMGSSVACGSPGSPLTSVITGQYPVRRSPSRRREHLREAPGRRPVAVHRQAAGALGLGDRLAAERDGAQRRHVGVKGDRGLLRPAGGDVDRPAGHRQAEPLAVHPQRVGGVGRAGRVEDRLERDEQRAHAQLTGRGHRLLAAPAAQFEQHRLQRAAARGELVDRDAGRRFEHLVPHQAGLFEVAQPLRQDVGADAGQAVAHLEEPFRPEDQFAYHQQGPAVADDVERAGDPAWIAVAARDWHAATVAEVVVFYKLLILS